MIKKDRNLNKSVETAFIQKCEDYPENNKNYLENFVETNSPVFSWSMANASISPVEHSHGKRDEDQDI